MADELVCVSLKDFLLRLMDEEHKRVDLRFNGMDHALILAKEASDLKFSVLNELRKEVVEDRKILLREDVYLAKTGGYDTWCTDTTTKINNVERDLGNRLTKVETKIYMVAGGITLLFTVIQIVIAYTHMVKG